MKSIYIFWSMTYKRWKYQVFRKFQKKRYLILEIILKATNLVRALLFLIQSIKNILESYTFWKISTLADTSNRQFNFSKC